MLAHSLDDRYLARQVQCDDLIKSLIHELRNLQRLMSLEETDGYMDFVLETTPALSKVVDHLRQDHARLRYAVNRIVCRFEQLSATDQVAVKKTCVELAELLQKLGRHSKRELILRQETVQ